MEKHGTNIKKHDLVLPCFLDRLTDRYPKAKTESIKHRVVSMVDYKNSILRDLSFLLNSNSHMQNKEFDDNFYAKKSVLNYGITPISGSSISDDKRKEIEKNIKNTIANYESRIRQESLEVKLVGSNESNGNCTIELIISGELLPLITYEKMYIKTIIDIETGIYRLRELKQDS